MRRVGEAGNIRGGKDLPVRKQEMIGKRDLSNQGERMKQ